MIERKFVNQKIREFEIEEYISSELTKVGHSHTKMVKTPLGERIIIFTSRPGLVVGRKGENIRKMTETLKKKFKLENPQIEIAEVENPNLDARIVGERIASALERFGIMRFKGIGHKALTDTMNAGALGIEVLISGKVPSARARTWRFYQGYLKKCGNIAIKGVDLAYTTAELKSGTVGIVVRIMPPWTKLPDDIELREEPIKQIEEIKEEKKEEEPKKKRVSRKKETEKKDESQGTKTTERS
ncbi:MAG: 30S ribosomal protein S3 [Candidatus Woesearchaeota archaeon]